MFTHLSSPESGNNLGTGPGSGVALVWGGGVPDDPRGFQGRHQECGGLPQLWGLAGLRWESASGTGTGRAKRWSSLCQPCGLQRCHSPGSLSQQSQGPHQTCHASLTCPDHWFLSPRYFYGFHNEPYPTLSPKQPLKGHEVTGHPRSPLPSPPLPGWLFGLLPSRLRPLLLRDMQKSNTNKWKPGSVPKGILNPGHNSRAEDSPERRLQSDWAFQVTSSFCHSMYVYRKNLWKASPLYSDITQPSWGYKVWSS